MSIRRLLRWPAMCDVVVVLSLAILTACGADSPEHLMASAKEYVAKREYSAAIIQLKNALRSEPNNGAARLLIAEAYLGSRDPVSAEKELRRALELNQPHEKTLPMLARALLEQGKHDEALAAFKGRRDETLKFLRGLKPEQWQRGGIHATRGKMTVKDFVELMAWHDDNHLDQLKRALDGKA